MEEQPAFNITRVILGKLPMRTSPHLGVHERLSGDIVAETLDGTVEAHEVKRNPQRCRPDLLKEKVAVMQRHLFHGKDIKPGCLSLYVRPGLWRD